MCDVFSEWEQVTTCVDELRNKNKCSSDLHKYYIKMLPLITMMDRMCKDECEAPSALLLLHDAYLKLIGGPGLGRDDRCLEHYSHYEKTWSGQIGWYTLDWTVSIRLIYYQQQEFKPLYDYLENADVDMNTQCMDKDLLTQDTKLLFRNIEALRINPYLWNLLKLEDFVEFDWRSAREYTHNPWINLHKDISGAIFKNYGFGHIDPRFFDALALEHNDPCE